MSQNESTATVLADFPEGWEGAKALLTDIPEEKREAFMVSYLQTILTM